MSTKITSSALALAVALGATAPAFAQSDPDIELFLRHPGAAATPGREHAISAQLEASIRAKEKQAAAARAEAISLLESFLHENARSDEAPEALYKLAELYWEDAKIAFLEAMGRYQAATAACHQDRSQC